MVLVAVVVETLALAAVEQVDLVVEEMDLMVILDLHVLMVQQAVDVVEAAEVLLVDLLIIMDLLQEIYLLVEVAQGVSLYLIQLNTINKTSNHYKK
jgi:hypothetical protein